MMTKHFASAFRSFTGNVVVLTGLIGMCVANFPQDAQSSDSPDPEKYHVRAIHVDPRIELSDPLWF
jgi:hypothetical protein